MATIQETMLVTVRTYPTPSTGHREVVCTGCVNESGEWRRLYPVPLRYLPETQQFKTWDVIKLKVRPPKADSRRESRRPDLPTLERLSECKSWAARAGWVQSTIATSMAEFKSQERTLGPICCEQVIDIEKTPVDPDWTPKQLAKLQAESLFDKARPLDKIPFEFHLRWRDCDGAEHRSLIISWEMAQTWRSYSRQYEDPFAVMKDKFLGDLFSEKRDVSFFMGNHSRFRDIFMVCGWFVPPKGEASDEQLFSHV